MIPQQPIPAGMAGVEAPLVIASPDRLGHAEDITGFRDILSIQGGVGYRDESPVPVMANETVQDQSPVVPEKQDDTRARIALAHWAYPDGFPGSDHWIHTRAEGRETDGIPLLQESTDQFPAVRRQDV